MKSRQSKTRTPVVTRRVPFEPVHKELFRLADNDGWTPPAEVVVRMGCRTFTYVADFTDAKGQQFRQTVKIDPVRRVVLDEQLSISVRVSGRAK